MRRLLRAGAGVPALFACTILLSAHAAPAMPQQPEPTGREAEVLAAVHKLFESMQARDTAALRGVFDPVARLMNTVTRDGQTTVRVTTVDQFVNSIASAPADRELNERIYAPEVRIDGTLATVWTFYTFHLGQQFSHCGVNAIQLLETSTGWRIVQLADTRRSVACEPPSG